MKRISQSAFAFLALAFLWATSVAADGVIRPVGWRDAGGDKFNGENGKEKWGDPACDSLWVNDGGLVFGIEGLLFKYHRADGVRAGSYSNVPPSYTDDVEFDHMLTPRITLGYVSDGGLGFRVRWWQYDQEGDPVFPETGVGMSVETDTLDLELFEVINLSERWTVEVSGGFRYNTFDELMVDPIPGAVRLNAFEGWGGIVGLEGRRSLGVWGGLYARARAAVMMDDKLVLHTREYADEQNALLLDSTLGMTELAVGYEISRLVRRSCVTFRTGYEWQNWYNYSSAFTPVTTTPPDNPPASFAGSTDVGFGGITLALLIER